jgi:hypothetical protein
MAAVITGFAYMGLLYCDQLDSDVTKEAYEYSMDESKRRLLLKVIQVALNSNQGVKSIWA